MIKNKISILVLASLCASATTISKAQENRNVTTLEEIVVTGSLITTGNMNQRAPVEIVDQEDILNSGYTSTFDIAKDLVSNSGSILSSDTGTLAGVGQFNLRGLGLGSTLTLINGRRAGISAIADGGGNEFFDITQLPLSMIERVEFLKDGASSTYGSQAVSGVANIITRSNFEGLELSVGTSDSVNPLSSISFASGSSGDKWKFNAYGTYSKQDRGDRSDYDFIVDRLGGRLQGVDIAEGSAGRLTSSTGAPGSYVGAVTDPTTGMVSPFSSSTTPDVNCEAAGGILVGARCRHDFFDQVSVIHEEERTQLFTEYEYQISDSVTLFGETHISNNQIDRTSGPGLFQNGLVDTGAILIPSNHPFNFYVNDPSSDTGITYIDPSQWDNSVHTATDVVCICRPLGDSFNGEGNAPSRRLDIDYVRTLVGASIDLNDVWSAEVWIQRAEATRDENVSFNYIADSVNGAALSGAWNPFGSALATPGLVSPKDGVSTAGNSESVLNSLYTNETTNYEANQTTIDVVVTGELFELSGGAVGVAFGAQYRDEDFSFTPDPLKAIGAASSPSIANPSSGEQEAIAVFTEALLPVTEDLEVQLALRYEDYGDTGGDTVDPKFAFRYSITPSLALRGSFGTSFQAPTTRQVSETISRQVFQDSAVVNPVTGALECGAGGVDISAELNVTGGPGLSPQSSENLNLGAVLQLDNGLDVSLDFWSFDYEDLIAQGQSGQSIVDNDCADGIPDDSRIERDGGGNIRRVNSLFNNTGNVATDGVDLGTRYGWDVNDGLFSLTSQLSYINKFEVTDDGVTFDAVGSRNNNNQFSSLPQLRANLGGSWSNGTHTVSATARFIDDYLNDANDETIDSFTTLDLNYAYTTGGDSPLTIRVGANNVFDEEPPTMGQGQRPGYDNTVHDVRGRILSLSITKKY